MSAVAILTDSASDLTPAVAAAAGITLEPLIVRFGAEEYKAHVDLSLDAFYDRMLAPGSPHPSTAACAPGDFAVSARALLDAGAAGVVILTVGSRLSATHAAALLAQETLGDAPVRVVDSQSVTMCQGLLALLGAEAAAAGEGLDAVADLLTARRTDTRMIVTLDTLEYLKRGGRISPAKAAIGSVLSVKPIITIEDGAVETVDKPRTAAKARARLLELASGLAIERLAVLHCRAPGIDGFRAELIATTGVDASRTLTALVGPSTAPHCGPGAYGFAALLRR
ncbi:MAG: DegV family protein [Chloroflexota bacterium]